MSENTKIEWADHTFNPWVGCTKISPACDHCYAEGWAKRSGQVVWGGERNMTSVANWKLPIKWDRDASAKGIRYRVFCASLADVFDNEVPKQWRIDLFKLILDTPNLDWLLLTKRIGNAAKMLQDTSEYLGAMMDANDHYRVLQNVWIGATICNQTEADRDIPKLLAVPAAKRFLSIEPLLGPVDLEAAYLPCDNWGDDIVMDPETGAYECCRKCDYTGVSSEMGIDWVIVGGESGPKARPMHPEWARSLRDQCEAAGVPFLFKQWGEWTPGENVERKSGYVPIAFLSGSEWNLHFEMLENAESYFSDEPDLYRVGKKAAGRLLDGHEWNGVPA